MVISSGLQPLRASLGVLPSAFLGVRAFSTAVVRQKTWETARRSLVAGKHAPAVPVSLWRSLEPGIRHFHASWSLLSEEKKDAEKPEGNPEPAQGEPVESKTVQPFGVPKEFPKVFALSFPRPVFPEFVTYQFFTDRGLIDQLKKIAQSSTPYVGIFMAKDDESRRVEVIRDVSKLHSVGSFCSVQRVIDHQKNVQITFNAHRRIRIKGVAEKDPFLWVNVENMITEPYDADDSMLKATQQALMECMKEIMQTNRSINEQIMFQLSTLSTEIMTKPGMLADFVAALCPSDLQKGQGVLEEMNIRERLTLALELLKKELVATTLMAQIQSEVEADYQKNQRRYMLMEQLKKIKKELGLEKDDKDALIERFQSRVKDLKMNESVSTVIDEELKKLMYLDGNSSEFNVTRNYLDWLTNMPWGLTSEDNYDISLAKTILDEDHYGLQDVKDRILEFIAVGSLRGHVHGKILCLCGPPGVGKTSIAHSIARSLNRQFFRFSVGGMTDVAEIKGHRRTYVGAMPGKLIQCLKKTKVENPLVLIDEIDKIGRGVQGDPASALLELLDPEQNASYMDHYLDVPVDLSKVLFICTANVTDTIPGPLLDRMEVIRLSGYVLQEKVQIAKQYLIPAARKQTGTENSQIDITEDAISFLCRSYCRENGVRNLQKHIEKIHRKLALKMVQGDAPKQSIGSKDLYDYVGKPLFSSTRMYDVTPAGVVMGLAWTSMGGQTLYIESQMADGGKHESNKGSLRTTGRLGETMNESAQIAYTFAKSFLSKIDPHNTFLKDTPIHMHCAEGAVPKDGPSAGCTFVSSLLSLALNRPLKPDVSMTGELSLTGKILPVGGIKEKLIAAKTADIKTVILPDANRPDYSELPEFVTEGLTVHFVKEYAEVFNVIFPDPLILTGEIIDPAPAA
eukprot:comp23700_c0_seq1/m.40716 comp23700_c0_seq1/g.40716  ORF comp23700_c0_seq1/g.40716 comp23700_c0_seq1/m.40716 type:complete len:909 (-) comp23700_c0_seq1:139-2865(-)